MTYERAATLEAAVAARAAGATLLGGGMSLVDLMALGLERPTRLVDVNHVAELARVEHLPDGACRIGALARMADVAADPGVRQRFPLLAEAVLSAASGQIRNAGSIAGNLLQRTRCPYFRDAAFAACNKRQPGSGCAALQGTSRGHAVFGASAACIATHPGDLAPALAAFDAVAEVAGPSGRRRELSVAELHRLPGDEPERDTQLGPDELIVALRLPCPAPASRSAYVKVRERQSYAYALVSAAVAFEAPDDVVRSARVFLGSVAPRPWQATVAEAVLIGSAPDETVFERAGQAAAAGASPTEDNRYKLALIAAAVSEALVQAWRRAST